MPGIDLPYLPWYPSDFYGSVIVAEMSDRQELWYRRLLDRSWQQKGRPCFLPNDPERLANICRCTPLDLQADGGLVLAQFRTTGDGKYIYNARLLIEYLRFSQTYAAQAAAGKNSAQKRTQASTQASTQANTEASRLRDTTQNSELNINTSPSGVRETESGTPEGLDQHQYAASLMEKACLPGGKAELEIVASSISAFAKEQGVTKAAAHDFILAAALEAVAAGSILNRFWFTDQRYKPQPVPVEDYGQQPNRPSAGGRTTNAADRRKAANLSATERALQRERTRAAHGS